MNTIDSRNDGHGHVTPRPDGYRSRCGGPAMCAVCQRERAAFEAAQPPQDERGHGLSDEQILAGVKEFADENYYANYKDDILRCVRTLLAASAPTQQAGNGDAEDVELRTGELNADYLKGFKDGQAVITPAQLVAAEAEKDAARYRWLRDQNWDNGMLCVVRDPIKNLRLGADCPSRDRLDEFIDAAMAGTGSDKSVEKSNG